MAWIMIISTILLFNSTAIFMRKRLMRFEMYTTILFALFLVLVTDSYASFRFQAWGFFEMGKAEFSVLFIVIGIYPAAAAMIINWYPYNSPLRTKFYYLMGWSLFSTAYEWLAVKVGILWHLNWNLVCSFFLYPIIYYLLILHVKIIRRNI